MALMAPYLGRRAIIKSIGERRTMDALTASLIVVGIAAAALILAALLTARSRIGVLPATTDPSSPWAGLPEQAKQFRLFGWVLVVLLYLAAVFCLLQGLNALRIVHHWEEWQATFGSILTAQAEIALYCGILDRDGDRALSYRLLGAAAFEAAFLRSATQGL